MSCQVKCMNGGQKGQCEFNLYLTDRLILVLHMLQPEMLQCNNCYILGKLLHFWFSTSTRNVTIMLQLLHFGQIVTFWADNVDQKLTIM